MNKTLLIGITVLFLLALAAPFTTASINQSEATCSDIRMVFPEVRLLEDSHETFDFDILNYGESAFRLTNITFDNKNSGDFDISADDHDGTINEADSEQFSFTVETDSVSRLTSGTAEVIIKGTFDQGVSCTNIRASFSVFVEDEEGAGKLAGVGSAVVDAQVHVVLAVGNGRELGSGKSPVGQVRGGTDGQGNAGDVRPVKDQPARG